MHFDQVRTFRVFFFQLRERVIDGKELLVVRWSHEFCLDEFGLGRISAALLSSSGLRTIDQDPAHRLRSGCEEMFWVFEKAFVALQPQVSFVNQSGGIQGLSLGLRADLEVGDAFEFVVYDLKQLLG